MSLVIALRANATTGLLKISAVGSDLVSAKSNVADLPCGFLRTALWTIDLIWRTCDFEMPVHPYLVMHAQDTEP